MINENASSYAYLIDCYDIWHAKLGHVNPTYVMKLQCLGLINMHDKQSKKCEICVESKLTKKPCPSVQHEIELLGLIHYDLVDLKQTMTRGGKNNFVTLMDYYSTYTKVYLIRHKDQVFDIFLSYKAEVENQLNRKIKRLRFDKVVSTLCLMTFVKRKV